MLSRVAERLYWLGRYIERAENIARVVNVHTHLSLDLPRTVKLGWQPIVDILGLGEIYEEHYENADEKSVIRFLVSDQSNPGSIISALILARENARTIRDVLPNEAWEQINELNLAVKKNASTGLSQRNRFKYFHEIILGTQQLTGLLAGTMTQDFGYDFLKIGRNLERADMTTRIIDVRSESLIGESIDDLKPFETIQWVSVLKSLSAFQMYRRNVQAQVIRAEVLCFLLKDVRFPRAILHCASEVKSCVAHLPQNKLVMESVAALHDVLEKTSTDKLSGDKLQKFMDELQVCSSEIHQRIVDSYFRHSDV